MIFEKSSKSLRTYHIPLWYCEIGYTGPKPRKEIFMRFLILPAILNLFDGEGGQLGGDSQSGGQTAAGGDDVSKLTLGKADKPEAGPDAGDKGSETPKDKAAKFRELIKGEYKDVFAQEFQKAFDRRYAQAKQTEERLNAQTPILDKLMARYGVDDISKLDAAIDSDSTFWDEAASRAGMDVDSYKRFAKLQRDNAALMRAQQERENDMRIAQQIQKWATDAEAFKAAGVYDFDVREELGNPDMRRLLQAGVSFQAAYEATHMEEVKRAIAQKSVKQTVDNVRAKGQRPAEVGAAASTGVSFNPGDPATWSNEQIDEAIRRAKRGERIVL